MVAEASVGQGLDGPLSSSSRDAAAGRIVLLEQRVSLVWQAALTVARHSSGWRHTAAVWTLLRLKRSGRRCRGPEANRHLAVRCQRGKLAASPACRRRGRSLPAARRSFLPPGRALTAELRRTAPMLASDWPQASVRSHFSTTWANCCSSIGFGQVVVHAGLQQCALLVESACAVSAITGTG